MRNRKCDTTSRVNPPSARRDSHPAASRCQPRGQAANPTSIASEAGAPTAPASIQARNCATAGEEAIGKFTAARAPSARATKSRDAAVSCDSGFSSHTARPAASAASASGRCAAGGAAT